MTNRGDESSALFSHVSPGTCPNPLPQSHCNAVGNTRFIIEFDSIRSIAFACFHQGPEEGYETQTSVIATHSATLGAKACISEMSA